MALWADLRTGIVHSSYSSDVVKSAEKKLAQAEDTPGWSLLPPVEQGDGVARPLKGPSAWGWTVSDEGPAQSPRQTIRLPSRLGWRWSPSRPHTGPAMESPRCQSSRARLAATVRIIPRTSRQARPRDVHHQPFRCTGSWGGQVGCRPLTSPAMAMAGSAYSAEGHMDRRFRYADEAHAEAKGDVCPPTAVDPPSHVTPSRPASRSQPAQQIEVDELEEDAEEMSRARSRSHQSVKATPTSRDNSKLPGTGPSRCTSISHTVDALPSPRRGLAKTMERLRLLRDESEHGGPDGPLSPHQWDGALTSRLEHREKRSRGVVIGRKGGEQRGGEVVPEVDKNMAKIIQQVVCGAGDAFFEQRLPPEKQSSLATDGFSSSTTRALEPHEKNRIEAVFNEIANRAGVTTSLLQTGSGGNSKEKENEELKELKDPKVSQGMVSVATSEFGKRLRGRLCSAHVQRLLFYFGWKGKVRRDAYSEKVQHLVTNEDSRERRLRICFGILDVDGDSVLGMRDVFAALGSSKSTALEEEGGGPNDKWEVLDAVFTPPGHFGIEWSTENTSTLEVVRVQPASAAEFQGVQDGDRLIAINGLEVDNLSPLEVRGALAFTRPIQLVFRRGQKQGLPGGIFALSDFRTLLKALKDRWTMKIRVKVTGLRMTECHLCVCEVVRRRGERPERFQFSTRGAHDAIEGPSPTASGDARAHRENVEYSKGPESSDPTQRVRNPDWEIPDISALDMLRFTVKHKDTSKPQEVLVPCVKLANGSFEVDLPLQDKDTGRRDERSKLQAKVMRLGDPFVNFPTFCEAFADRDPLFFPILTEILTGCGPNKVRVTVVSASGPRNDKSECSVEILGKSPKAARVSIRLAKPATDNWEPESKTPLTLPDYTPGDALHFNVFERVAKGASQVQLEENVWIELLGEATLQAESFWNGNFEGVLELRTTGKSTTNTPPQLRIKVQVIQGSSGGVPSMLAQHVAVAEKAAASSAAAQGTASGQIGHAEAHARHDQELGELRSRRQQLRCDAEWHVKVFEALMDKNTFLIHRELLMKAAEKLFSVSCSALASRLFDVVSREAKPVSVLDWALRIDQYCGEGWELEREHLRLSFALYDFDGDGVISMQDAVAMAREVDRLQPQPELEQHNEICEEMRFLYVGVASADQGRSRDLQLDDFNFQQVCPSPKLAKVLVANLVQIAHPQSPVKTIPGPAKHDGT